MTLYVDQALELERMVLQIEPGNTPSIAVANAGLERRAPTGP
ncbi:hypothetical protein [Streptomyces noursei]|nr:hypothetical protein [Streptomyces noursei]